MQGGPGQSGGVGDPKAVAFASVHHLSEGGLFFMVVCWIFAIGTSVAACSACPTILICGWSFVVLVSVCLWPPRPPL